MGTWRARKFVRDSSLRSDVVTLRDTHRTRCWRCGGLRAGGRVADLLVAAWLMATAAAGMIEAKKMQRMVWLLLLCAEGSQELNCGCWCGV